MSDHGQCLHLGYRWRVGRFVVPVASSCQRPRPERFQNCFFALWLVHLNLHGQCLHLGYRRWVGRYGEPVAESCQSPRPKHYLPSLPLTFLIEYSSTPPYLTLGDAFIIKQFVRLGLCEPRHGPNGFASIHSSVCSRRAYVLILVHCRSSAVLGHLLARPSIPYHPPQGTVSMPIGAPLE